MSEKRPLYRSPGTPGKRGFEDLECYQLALQVMARVHEFSKTLPPDEKFDLYVQIRRSTKGVTGNIGEACGRYHYLDSLRYYSIARRELNETLAHLINAHVPGYINQTEFEAIYRLIRQTEQALNGYMTCIRKQRAGAQELGDKAVREDSLPYLFTNLPDTSIPVYPRHPTRFLPSHPLPISFHTRRPYDRYLPQTCCHCHWW